LDCHSNIRPARSLFVNKFYHKIIEKLNILNIKNGRFYGRYFQLNVMVNISSPMLNKQHKILTLKIKYIIIKFIK